MREEATKDTFLSEAVGRRHLHLATHGFFRAAGSAEIGVSGRSLVDNHPGLLCGLAFAGANGRGSILEVANLQITVS